MKTAFVSTAATGILAIASLAADADPRVASWFTGGASRYARIYTDAAARTAGSSVTTWSNGSQTQAQPAYAGVQAVYSSADWVYLRTTGLGQHVMGPWQVGFPNLPANQHAFYRIPRNPVSPASKTLTGGGPIGYFVDGVAMFDSRDAFYWNGTTDTQGTGNWNRDAYVNEGATFDPALAHQQNTGTYHYHANPIALRHLLGDHVAFDNANRSYAEAAGPAPHHSPILGWVRDGWPVYGPYGYASASDATGGIRRMVPGYVPRDGKNGTDNLTATGRNSLPAWATRLYGTVGSQTGPAVSGNFPLGRYMEDNAYLGDLGKTIGSDFDLDEQNGRWCVTPEFPDGVYAYFVAIDANGTPVFPYNIGRAFHGSPTGTDVSAISETVTTHFLGGTNRPVVLGTPVLGAADSVVLTWTAVEGGTYTVERSSDLGAWHPIATGIAAIADGGTATVATVSNPALFHVGLTAVAAHDAVDAATGNTGGGGGGGVTGPVLASVAPTAGDRGTTVTVTLTLGANPPPPDLQPKSAKLGAIVGTNLSRNGSQITARFAIPAGATPGAATPSVTFGGPPGMGDVTFSLANGFTIL